MTARSFVLLLLSVCVASTGLAQSPATSVTLFGKVQDAQTKSALPSLTVQLRTEKDSVFVGGRLTNEAGAFTFAGLKKGTYLLEVRSIGYQPIRQRVLVGELSAFLDLGALLMVKETQTLGAVVVTGRTDATELEKKTFTVADTISQAGGSVLQAMSTLPGVTVGQDGKVEVRGSDKVVVLIDGKQTALTGYGSQNSLDNIPASPRSNHRW
jgi:hypothetical protein